MKEMAKFATVSVVYDATLQTAESLTTDSWTVSPNADFFHIVDDDKSTGIEVNNFPRNKVPSGQPLVCDMTSTLFSKPIDWSMYDVVYADTQKYSAIG